MFKKLFAKKSIQDLKSESKGGLERSLTGLNLIALGIGAIVGAGIFVLIGQASSEYAGPGVVFSFIFAAILCVFAALCYAEFASLIPIAGGPYSYAYATLGEIVAWSIGWSLTLEYLFSSATVSVGWSGYLSSFLADVGINLPMRFSEAPLSYSVASGWAKTGAILNLPAMFIMGAIGGLIAVGIKAAARFNNIMVVVKVGVILLFLGCGIAYVNTANWTPFIPENTGIFGQFGFSGILRGAGVVFFAFIGFDALSTLAQEARNPQKDMPIGMVGSLTISAGIYILLALVITGLVSYKFLGGPAPFSVAIDALGSNFIWLRYVAKFGILAGLTSVVMVMLLGQTRIFYSMAHDGLLPKIFGDIHKKYHTPFWNTLILTGFGMLVCGLLPVGILGQLVSMGTLLAFAIVCIGVLILRYKQPSLHRPFKVPFFPWIPILGALTCLVQMALLPGVTWIQLCIWVGVGFIIYFSYGMRNSHLQKKK